MCYNTNKLRDNKHIEKCDRKTANAMIMHRRDNIKALVARM